MSETPGTSMGRKLRPQRQSTQGLRQNQTPQGGQQMPTYGGNLPSVGADPISILDGLIQDYVKGFQGYQDVGSNRLRDQVQLDLVKRGIQGDATGVDILNRNLSDYTSQQNAALGQSLIPLYTAMASLAQQAQEAAAGRTYNSQFAKEQINNQLDFMSRRIPIDSQAYRTAYLLEQSLNKANRRGTGGFSMPAGVGGVLGGEYRKPFGEDYDPGVKDRFRDTFYGGGARDRMSDQFYPEGQDTFDLIGELP